MEEVVNDRPKGGGGEGHLAKVEKGRGGEHADTANRRYNKMKYIYQTMEFVYHSESHA